MRADRFPNDVTPLLLKAQLKQMGLQAETFRQSREDGAERIQGTGSAHGESYAAVTAGSRGRLTSES
jgi:hypothetical protein